MLKSLSFALAVLFIQTADAGECVPQSLLDDISGYIAEQGPQSDHVKRWKNARSALNGNGGLTIADAQSYVDRGWGGRWQPVVDALQCLENEKQQPEPEPEPEPQPDPVPEPEPEPEPTPDPQPEPDPDPVPDPEPDPQPTGYNGPYKSLYDKIKDTYIPEQDENSEHVKRWERVLAAFDGDANPMTASEAQTYLDKGWSRWEEVVVALNDIEGNSEVTVDPPELEYEAQSDSQTTYTVTVNMPTSVTEGDGGTQQSISVNATVTPSAPPNEIVVRVKGPASAGTARPTNFSSGNPVWHDGTANPNWDYAFQAGGFVSGYIVRVNTDSGTLGTISIHNDDIYEGDETIGFVVTCESGCSGSNYTVNVVNDATPTVIKDNDPKPVYTLSAPSNVEEGSSFDVTVNSDRKAQPSLTVPVLLDDVNDIGYVTDGTNNVTLDPYAQSGTLSVSTSAVASFRIKDTITATLQNPTTGTIGSPSSATVEVTESSKPTISITAPEVTEGEDIVVTATADKAVNADYRIRIVAAQLGNDPVALTNLGNRASVSAVGTMSAEKTTTEIRMPTTNDNRKSGDGTINILIAGGDYYKIVGNQTIGNYKIKDSGIQPVTIISFASDCVQGANPPNHIYEEQGAVTCSLISKDSDGESALTGNVEVKYEVVEGSNQDYFVDTDNFNEHNNSKRDKGHHKWGYDYSSEVHNYHHLSDLMFQANDDFDDDADGTALIRLLPGEGYELGKDITRELTLFDDDDFFTRNSVSVAGRLYTPDDEHSFTGNLNVDHSFDVDNFLGEILELSVTTSIRSYQAQEIRIIYSFTDGISLIDSDHLETIGGTTYLKQKAIFPANEREVIIRVPFRSSLPDNIDFTGKDNIAVSSTFAGDYVEDCTGCTRASAMSFSFRVYPPTPELDPGDPDYIANAHEYTAKQCVEKNIPRGTKCGTGNKEFLVEFKGDTSVAHNEDQIKFYVYATPALDDDQDIKVTWKGKNICRNSGSSTACHRRFGLPMTEGEEVFSIPPSGTVITLPVDDNWPEWSDTLDVSFQSGNSLYSVADDSSSFEIKTLDDDPMKWEWTENTLGDLDEGSYTKIGKIAMVKPHFLVIPDGVSWELDFNVEGCALQDTNPITDGTPAAGENEDIPCYISLDNAQRLTSDSFRGSGYVGNGWSFEVGIGQDADTVDEVITFDPVFYFEDAPSPIQLSPTDNTERCDRTSGNYDTECLGNFMAYDDDKVDDPNTPELEDRITTQDVCVAFTISKYQVVENNSPTQPVIKLYEYDSNTSTCKDGENGTTSTVVDGNLLIREASIPFTVSHITTDDDDLTLNLNRSYNILIASGTTTAKFDIHTVTDKKFEPTERFRVSIDTSNLPVGIKAGNRVESIVEIIDTFTDKATDIERRCGLSYSAWSSGTNYAVGTIVSYGSPTKHYQRIKAGSDTSSETPDMNSEDWTDSGDMLSGCNDDLKITYKILTGEVYEEDFTEAATISRVEFDVELTSTRDIVDMNTANIAINPVNLKGDRLYTWRSRPQILSSKLSLDAQVPKVVTYRLFLNKEKNSLTSDYPDGQISHEWIDVLNPGNTNRVNHVAEVIGKTWIRDGYKSGNQRANFTLFGITKAVAGNFKDYSQDNLFVVGVRPNSIYGNTARDLKEWEKAVLYLTWSTTTGTIRTLEYTDYEIEVVAGQPNVSMSPRESSDHEHVFTIKGTNDTSTFTCGTLTINRSQSGCFKFINKQKGKDGVLDKGYNIIPGMQPGPGENIKTTYDSTSRAIQVDPDDSPHPDPDPSATRTISIVTTTSLEIDEPAPKAGVSDGSIDQSWVDVPFDILIDPRPVAGTVTQVKICMGDESTATYYRDYRIVDSDVSRLNLPEGGLAYDGRTKCTRSSIPLRYAKTKFYVRVHGDHYNDDDEKIVLNLRVTKSDPANNLQFQKGVAVSTVTYTINNEGIMPKAFLARYGRALGEQAFDAIAGRMQASASPGLSGNAGQQTGDSMRDLFMGAAFSYGSRKIAGLSTWGTMSHAGFSGDEVSGNTWTWQGGMDYRRDNWITGMAVLYSEADGKYGGGDVDADMLAAMPYAGITYDTWSAWGMAGYGQGDMALIVGEEDDEGKLRMGADTDWLVGALALERQLFETLDWTGDALYARMTSADSAHFVDTESDTIRLRTGLTGKLSFAGLDVSPSVRGRYDAGDAETGYSLEYGGQAGFNWRGLQIGLTGAHTLGEVDSKRISLGLSWVQDGTGPYADLAPQGGKVGYRRRWHYGIETDFSAERSRAMLNIQVPLN